MPVRRLAPTAGSLKQGDKPLLDSRQSLCCMKIVSYLSKQPCQYFLFVLRHSRNELCFPFVKLRVEFFDRLFAGIGD